MVTTNEAGPTLRRAVLLTTATSFLVPAVGVLTQPILAHSLGVDGRGEFAAAIAPAGLAVAVATLGLPDALTFYLAKHPRLTRSALAWATAISVALGLVCLLVTAGFLPFLSTGDSLLGFLILLGMALTIPAFVVGVFRGAAAGRQQWATVAAERIINVTLRIVVFGTLFLAHELTVFTAVLVTCIAPVVAGVVYWPLLRVAPHDAAEPTLEGGILRPMLSFGSRVWLGAVASMLLSRVGQILMAPLSSVTELGLYSVAGTISDVPLIVAIAIQGALYGVNSRSTDATSLTGVTRLTLLLGFAGCAVLGGTLPWWIGPLFGREFAAATVPTIMLMVSALICIPGLMAATGIAAWGRPGLRSLGLGITVVANVAMFVVLVPLWGVYGACWTSILTNVFLTSYMVVVASRVMKVPPRDFVLVRAHDVARARHEVLRLVVLVRSRVAG